METLDPGRLARYDALFVAPRGEDALLSCPARILGEAERGRRALVLALFEPRGPETDAERLARSLGAEYAAAGLPSVAQRRQVAASSPPPERSIEDDGVSIQAVRLLTLVASRTQAVQLFAPLGLSSSADHALAYEAAVRAFASEAGKNLFLYEERPEAFVPGAVRTRLALLGARLPPAAQRAPERGSLVRYLWAVNDPLRIRGSVVGLGDGLSRIGEARRRFGRARAWNPLRAFGPRLHPSVLVADEEARQQAGMIAEALLPRDARGRPRAAERFAAGAERATRRLGGLYHAERCWLYLPSGDGLAESQYPLDAALA
jgi:hypothetical protein